MAKKIGKELRKSTNTTIVAAFGFLIALVWRDLIVEYINNISSFSPIQGKLFTALLITAISVLGIFITNWLLKIKK